MSLLDRLAGKAGSCWRLPAAGRPVPPLDNVPNRYLKA